MTVIMKTLAPLLLALASICLAGAVPTSNGIMPHAVQSDAVSSTIDTVLALGDGGKNEHHPPVSLSGNRGSEARVLQNRAETPDRAIPDNLYRFSVSYSEYCENGVLKARGTLGNEQGSYQLALNPTQVTKLHLHPNYDLVAGPYSFSGHGFLMEYDNCKWTSEGGYPCGWCEQKPWSLGELNCQTGQPAVQRLTYRTCYFVDNHQNSQSAGGYIDLTSSTSTVEDIKAVAARDELYSPPPAPVNLTLDVSINAPVRMFDDPSMYYNFALYFQEFCENGVVVAAGQYHDGHRGYDIKLTPYTETRMILHAPAPNQPDTLVIGPYSLDWHYAPFQYGECKFNSNGLGFDCGWCKPQPWTSGALNCVTGAPATKRYTYSDCYIKDANIKHIGNRDTQTPAKTPIPTPIESLTFELPSATLTPAPQYISASPPSTPPSHPIDILGSTLTLKPGIIETHTPDAQNKIILPFHISLLEHCTNNHLLASAVYTNGNMAQALDLQPGLQLSIDHRVPGYADLVVGPYDYEASMVRFAYTGCGWTDGETWRSCGECRAALWSGGSLDCGVDGVRRTKEMDCSVLLGLGVLGAGQERRVE